MVTVGTVNEREETVIEWSIPDFPSLSQERTVSYFSPLFYFNKESWCMELCPNGEKEDRSNVHMHVYLHRKSSDLPIEIFWCIGIKGSNGYRTSVFINRKHNSSTLWITRDDILEKKSEYLSSDALSLLCFIKHPQCMGFSDNLPQTNSESIQFLSKSNLASSNLKTVGKINQREDFVVEWSIKDFLSFGDGVSYFSPFFSFGNVYWCIEVSAECKKRESEELIPVYLRKKSSGPPMKIEYKFGYHGYFYVYTDYLTRVFNEIEYNDGIHEFSSFFIKKALLSLCPLTLECRIDKVKFIEYSSKEATLKSSKNIREYTVLQDLKQLFLKQKDCDVVLKVRGQEFSAHRNILAARSLVFESTFRNDMKEKETGIVNIEDCDPSSFSDFLCFLYCGEIETLSEENVFSLFTTANKYDVQDLRKICMEFMKESISVDTFCDTITLALQHSETELIRLATDFFTKNSLKIVKTVPWQNFAAENPTQSNELVIKGFEAAAKVIS